MVRSVKWVALSLLLVFGQACSDRGAINVRDYKPAPLSVIEDYRIGVDDRLTVNVWRNPDLNINVPVRPDGKISVPLVGDVKAGGETVIAIAEQIKKKLSRFIRDPQVTVIVSTLQSHEFLSRVRVTGAVRSQQSVNYRQGMTILDLVLLAGGLDEFADANNTVLYRKEKSRTVAIKIELKEILNNGALETNLSLRPGDILSIPERIF